MKLHINRKAFGVLILGATTLLMPAAQAEAVWTHVAGACAIDKNSAANAYVLDSELRFDVGHIGEIVARCNVINPRDDGQGPAWKFLEVVYRDPDGNLLPNQVKVILKRVTNAGANVVVATFDSNAFLGGAAPVMNSIVFPHVFNFSTNAYWIEIRIKRSSGPTPNNANNPSAFLVRLR